MPLAGPSGKFACLNSQVELMCEPVKRVIRHVPCTIVDCVCGLAAGRGRQQFVGCGDNGI